MDCKAGHSDGFMLSISKFDAMSSTALPFLHFLIISVIKVYRLAPSIIMNSLRKFLFNLQAEEHRLISTGQREILRR